MLTAMSQIKRCSWADPRDPLMVAYHDDEMDSIRHTLSVGRGLGVPMEIIDVAEARKHHPFFNFDGVKAVLHTPDDGHVDPAAP